MEGASAHTQQLAKGVRDHGEATMESFIKHQMMVILQPFLDHIQVLDGKFSQLSDRLQQTDANVSGNRKAIEGLQADMLDLRTELKKTNTQVKAAHDGVDACMKRDDMLQQGMELQSGFAQRLHDQLLETGRMVPELQRHLGELECGNQELRVQMQSTNDSISTDIRRTLGRLDTDVKNLQAGHSTAGADLSQLRKDMDHNSKLMNETRQVLDMARSHAAGLQKGFEELREKEAQLNGRLEGWKGQWSKLHPAIEALRKDTAHLMQSSEHHNASIHNLQQGYATTFGGVEDLRSAHENLGNDVVTLRHNLAEANRGIGDVRDNLAKTTSFANGLHTGLHRTDAELKKAGLRLDTVEKKHTALSDGVEKTKADVSDMMRDGKKVTTTVQILQHEMEKAHDNMNSTRGLLDSANTSLHGLRAELGRTNDTVKNLDQGVELCRAGFSGLQRGFVETGTHLTSRPINLPKLPKSPPIGMPSPRAAALAAAGAAAHIGTTAPPPEPAYHGLKKGSTGSDTTHIASRFSSRPGSESSGEILDEPRSLLR